MLTVKDLVQYILSHEGYQTTLGYLLTYHNLDDKVEMLTDGTIIVYNDKEKYMVKFYPEEREEN